MMLRSLLSYSVIVCAFVFVIPSSLSVYATGDLADIVGVESSNVFENDWKSYVELAANGSFRLSWKATEYRIVFLAEVKTRGYFELGFSFDGRTSDADIVVGWVNDITKKAYLIVSSLRLRERGLVELLFAGNS